MSGVDNHTLALLHFDDTDNIIKDEVGVLEWAKTGSFKLSTDCKFGAASLIVSNGYMKSTTSDVISKISGDNPRTIDFWSKYQKSSTSESFFYIFGSSTADKAMALKRTSKLITLTHWDNNRAFEYVSDTDEWHHFAHVYDGTTEYLFIDGKKFCSFDIALTTGSDYFMISPDYRGNSSTGYNIVDEFRVSDIARWTEDFVPPAVPYRKNNLLYLDENNAVWGCKA